MARHDDGERVSAIGCADGPGRARVSQLGSELPVGSCFAEWDSEQCVPEIALKSGASHVECDGECFSASGEIFAELTPGLDKNGLAGLLSELAQAYATRRVIFPENRDQAFVTGDQFKLAHRKWHGFIEETHGVVGFPFSILAPVNSRSVD